MCLFLQAMAEAEVATVSEGRPVPRQVDEASLQDSMALAQMPDPDLFVRTGGECRINRFLLRNPACTEPDFIDTFLWSGFDATAFETAQTTYGARQRHYGCVIPAARCAYA